MPDRVTPESVLFFVTDHERRIQYIENRTEDFNLVKDGVDRANANIHNLRGEISGISKTMATFASHEDVDGLRKALYTFALSVAGSAMLFAITLFAVLK